MVRTPQNAPSQITFPPNTHQAFLEGIDRLVNLIRPTFGPLPRYVLYSNKPSATPEQLDSGGLIARRMQLRERSPSAVGTELIRNALVKMQEEVGDGTAAAAVMLQVAFREGARLVSAGGSPMLLRRYLDEGLQLLIQKLEDQRVELAGKERLAHFAAGTCRDPILAQYLGEIFDVIGEYGRLEILAGKSKELEREYIDGFYWEKGMVSPHMANQLPRPEAFLANPAILLTNYYLHDPAPLVSLLDTAVTAGYQSLLLVALGFSEKVIGLFASKANQEKVWVVGVEPAATGDERLDFIQDVAVLTGATPILRASDIETELTFSSVKNLAFVRPEHFGHARRAWVTQEAAGISGGKADSRYLRHYIQDLKQRYERETDETNRQRLRVRLGKFLGGSATLWIGGSTPLAIQQRKELAETTSRALRGAIRSGVVPGGGAALLACRDVVEMHSRRAQSLEERMAYTILSRMVEEPARALLTNAGVPPDMLLEEIRQSGTGFGCDLHSMRLVDMLEAGITDSAAVVQAAVRTAVSTTTMALTTDVILGTCR